jgi:hypothetical protein
MPLVAAPLAPTTPVDALPEPIPDALPAMLEPLPPPGPDPELLQPTAQPAMPRRRATVRPEELPMASCSSRGS